MGCPGSASYLTPKLSYPNIPFLTVYIYPRYLHNDNIFRYMTFEITQEVSDISWLLFQAVLASSLPPCSYSNRPNGHASHFSVFFTDTFLLCRVLWKCYSSCYNICWGVGSPYNQLYTRHQLYTVSYQLSSTNYSSKGI